MVEITSVMGTACGLINLSMLPVIWVLGLSRLVAASMLYWVVFYGEAIDYS